ncbi:FK506-binding protein 1A [Maublancomyces gigas]|uniref:peptidylprolyl isomerase n=1 Tax=Discina gigas TaxID=1032678 RepID=A0ABR3GR47_9PEZI
MGVELETLCPGNGVDFPKKGDEVTIDYTGRLLDGSKFDSSVDRKKPFVTKIGVGKVIRGWDEGVPKMSLGQKAILTITSDYAYGERGFSKLIPPNSTLLL